jgi:multiple sugar transport system ATP-binding protein
MAEITMEGLTKVYAGGTLAVGDLDLTVEDGEFLVLVGPSGCGKSTVLRMIAGLESITAGTMHIGDNLVNDVPPKDRDIAMVFQNYALYPHMTVYDNMAFGLKLRKLPKDEIRRRVADAAEILEITEFLDRKPAALSGGQRQRVAMGRAIVREPSAFLMDEPLSNLDAKLRVQMRAELERLQDRLGTTTVYVTHDQVEAMTLGDRVAVLRPVSAGRPYNLQQVGAPTELFDRPANLFVAGFIGSPAMNLLYVNLEADDDHVWAVFGEHRIEVDPKALEAHPGLTDRMNEQLVMGLRPTAMRASTEGAPNSDRTIRIVVEVDENLGAETYIHSTLEIPPVITPDVEELLADSGRTTETLGDTTQFVARISSDVPNTKGEGLDLLVDTTKLHFFDPESGERIGLRAEAATA